MTLKSYSVAGMTCDHCVLSVHEEVSEIAGVSAVEVDLDSGLLRVDGDVCDAAVREAVEAAGYEVVA